MEEQAEQNWVPTISFIIFWDFSMFYQIFLWLQVKRWAIITYKHGINKLPHDLLNDLGSYEIRKNQEIVWTSYNDSLVPSLPAKIEVLLILEENSWKTAMILFALCAIADEN